MISKIFKTTFTIFMAMGFLFGFYSGCKSVSDNHSSPDYTILKPFSKNGKLQAVIEIPAGTNLKIEYDKEKNRFLPDKVDGKDRIVEYLPYPGNYGFIPGTLMDTTRGGDGDALDVLVIAESIPTGSVLEIIPIALFGMLDAGELDNKVIAIPADSKLQTFKLKDYEDLSSQQVKAKLIIQYWFESYKGAGVEAIRWQDTPATIREIKKWIVPEAVDSLSK